MKAIRPALPLLVAVAAFLPFLPSLQGEFVAWDDTTNFVGNQHFRGLGWSQLRWMATATLLGHWIPLTWLTFGVNYVLGGMNPWGYHLGNLLLHAANAAIFCVVARRLIAAGFGQAPPWPPAAWGGAAAALLFAVHPLRAESVAWITERRDVLSGLGGLLAVWAYLRGVEGERLLSGRWLLASLAFFAASLVSKSITMTLPLVLLLLDVYPLRRGRLGWRALLGEKAPHVLLAGAAALMAVWAVRRSAVFTSLDAYGPGARAALGLHSLWFYPAKMLWPSGLTPLYELPLTVSLAEWRFLGPGLAVVAITAVLVLVARRWPAGLAAWACSAIVLAPVSGVVHAGYQLAHDRYSYLSGLPLAVLAGAGVAWGLRGALAERLGARLPAALAAIVLVVAAGLGVLAWRQTAIWVDSVALWEAAIRADPECALCHRNLGIVLVARKQLVDGEVHLRRALGLRPRRSDMHEELGKALNNQERYLEAEEVLRRGVELDPRRPRLHSALGGTLASQNRYDEAIVSLREAIRLWGGSLGTGPAEPRAMLGEVYIRQGRPAEGILLLERALALDPDLNHVRVWLARAYRAAGHPDKAERLIAELGREYPELAAAAAEDRVDPTPFRPGLR